MTKAMTRRGPAVLSAGSEADVLRRLVAPFAEAAARARRDGRPVLVSVSEGLPRRDWIAVFEAARARGADAMLWYAPWQDAVLLGVGTAWSAAGAGPDRFARVSLLWRVLVSDAVVVVDGEPAEDQPAEGEQACGQREDLPHAAGGTAGAHGERAAAPGPGPVLLGGFAFDAGGAGDLWEAFGEGRLDLPRVMYGDVAGRAWVTLNAVVGPDDDPQLAAEAAARDLAAAWAEAEEVGACAADEGAPGAADGVAAVPETAVRIVEEIPPRGRWLAAVAETAAAVRSRVLEKAVLARCVRIAASRRFDVGAALRYLLAHYPACYLFAVARGGDCFLGATPERIVRKTGGLVHVACLAGSVRRGATPAEDEELGRWLLSDAKNAAEHRIVLRAIIEALAPACVEVSVGGTELRRLANVQHLYTPVTAQAAHGVDVLELTARVHPTPALAGYPREAALAWIREREGWARGWYAGPVGWMDWAGDGEFAAGLRSALVRGEEAWLFAGCGIMGDSVPESEYEESALKLRPMLAALEASL